MGIRECAKKKTDCQSDSKSFSDHNKKKTSSVMTQTKNVSRAAFVGSHTGAILFNVIIGIMVYVAQTRKEVFGYDSGNFTKVLAILLIVVSILGMVPILMKKKYIIE
jgi:hypothetical protein